MKNSKPLPWSRLDNAAKIFPPTSSSRDTKVFRFACQLHEIVEPDILQHALDKTMEVFPFYRSVLKKGLFWYYFESSDKPSFVTKESKPLCAPLYNHDRKNLLFEVSYFEKRINLEVYHALSDGTGALHFLRTMVFYYLLEKHKQELDQTLTMDYDASMIQKGDDSFAKYYDKHKSRLFPKKINFAHQIRAERFTQERIGVIEGVLSVEELLKKSKQYQVSISAFLTAIFIYAIKQTMSVQEKSKPVVITIPVNLRRFFPSESARNFFGVINVGYHFQNQENSLESIISFIKNEFQQRLNAERLQESINNYSRLEHILPAKMVPLFFKNIVMKIANIISEWEITASFSNVGKVTMPVEMEKYIELFDVFISTKRIQACACSYQDKFVISFTSPFLDTEIQKNFFRTLTEMGLFVTITAGLP